MKIKQQYLSIFSKMATLDTRSLAIFRVALGTLILVDLYSRSIHFELFYTNNGISVKNPFNWFYGRMSLYTMYNTVEWAEILFIVAAIFAVLMILGLFTRFATPISWFLLVSLQNRDSLVLNDGDKMFALALFMAIFLPINHRFSIDSLIWKRQKVDNYYSIWTIGYIFQLIIIYAVAGWAKWSSRWHAGLGVYYSLMLHTYAKASAAWLLKYPFLYKLLSHHTLIIERVGWIILLIPKRMDFFKMLAVILFAGLHFGLFLFMELGIFTWVGMAVWIPLIPASVWNWLLPFTKGHQDESADNPENGFGRLFFKFGKIGPFAVQIVGALAIFLNIYHNLHLNDHPMFKIDIAHEIIYKFRLRQGWRVFTGPPTKDGWAVIDAVLEDSTHVNLLKGTETSWDKPALVSAEYEAHRLRKYSRKTFTSSYQQKMYTQYLVRKWNESHPPDKQVARAVYWYLSQDILADCKYGPINREKGYVWEKEKPDETNADDEQAAKEEDAEGSADI